MTGARPRCGIWFPRLADRRVVRCSLSTGHACAHAWTEPDVEVELVRVAFEAGRRAEREDVVAWFERHVFWDRPYAALLRYWESLDRVASP